MEKSTKITCIVAVVLMLVGGIVALVCMVLGGDLDDLKFYIEIPFQNEQQDATDMAAMMDGAENLNTWNFAGEEIHSLDLDIEAGTLSLQQGESWQVLASNGRKGLRCEVKNGVLKIKETDSIYTLLDWSGNSTPHISVTIPGTAMEESTLETIHVSVGAGSVQAKDLNAKYVEIDVDAGNFSCVDLAVNGHCQIDVDAGNVDIRGGQIQGRMQINMDVGRVTYQGSLEGDWQVDCDAGNVKMELAASMDEYNYQVEYDLGTVRIGSQEFNGMSDQVSLFNDARYEAQIQCDVGLVDVSFSQ